MSKDIRRVHPRVSYEQKIRLLGSDGKPVIIGRTMNLSPSGIYVRAPKGCDVGSEVTCDLPLPGGTRQIHGRVARTQALPDATTGLGIQFVDLTTADSSSLHRALEGSGSRPVAVKVMFEGMTNPIKCQGVITAEGIRLSTSLPFLRLGSDVQAVYDGRAGKTDARGVLTGVRLEPVAGDGVPRLGVEVDIEAIPRTGSPIASPHKQSTLSSRGGDQALVSGEISSRDQAPRGRFTQWNQPPPVRSDDVSPVTGGFSDLGGPDTTAIVARPGMSSFVLARLESLHAWGFVAVATLTFSIVYAAMYRFGPAAEARNPVVPSTIPTAARSSKPLGPMIVRAAVPGAVEETGSATNKGSDRSSQSVSNQVVDPTGPATRRVRARQSGSPFRFDSASGRYQLRPGAALDMQGTALTGVGGLASGDSATGNLRGINVSVEAGALYFAVPLERPEVDARFGVQVTPSWPTPLAIVGKTTTGFTVSFGTPAPADAHFDWFLVR